MLPKQHRLTRREDFSLIFSKGSYAQIPEGIAIKFIKTDLPTSRLGFPVGKNFSKKAVDRNRARRVLRSASFKHLENLKPGFDIIVLLKPGKKDLVFEEITAQLKKVFAKANLLI